MSRTEELIRQAQAGDREASELLVQDNSGLIWSVARRFIGRGTESDDLYQLGCVGFRPMPYPKLPEKSDVFCEMTVR